MTRRRSAPSARSSDSPERVYRVRLDPVHTHRFLVTLELAQPASDQLLQLPVWIPGSYLVREFARHLQSLRCTQGGRTVAVHQLDKARWRVQCQPDVALQIDYTVYAFDRSVRTAWLDASRGFFNGTSLLLQVVGQAHLPHQLEVVAPDDLPAWNLATGLTPVQTDRRGFGIYGADNYQDLVDCPIEMGPFWAGGFTARGVPHRFVVSGASDSFDGQRLLDDARAICEQEIDFWHAQPAKTPKLSAPSEPSNPHTAPPFSNYLFLLNVCADDYGGLEHHNSTALICPRKDLPRKPPHGQATARQPEGYTRLLGLISHEYFHTWNVKRLRPAEFASYDYTQENYTELLWFFEGFTSYYDDLLLRRSERIDDAHYLKLLGKTINQVLQTPGRRVQSVAQSSFDAWTKYYRPDENTPNLTVSYYTKGALVALCLDLRLRTEGKTTLDAVMQALWHRCNGGPMTQADLLAVLQTLSGRSYAREITQWVHGTRELPLQRLLEAHGVQCLHDPEPLAQQLGLRVKDGAKHGGALHIQHVLRGGAAEQAGFAAGDEWLAVQSARPGASGPWRIHTLDDIAVYCSLAKAVRATIVRDGQLHVLALRVPKAGHVMRLAIKDAAQLRRWLIPSPVRGGDRTDTAGTAQKPV